MKKLVTFIRESLTKCSTSKCERYLLSQCGNQAAKTIAKLWIANRNEETVIVDGIEYHIFEFPLPETLAKSAVEASRVFLSPAAIGLCKPLMTVKNDCDESMDDIMNPTAFRKFWEDYYSYSKDSKTISQINKDDTLIVSDLFAAKSNNSWINLGGTKISEDVCLLNEFELPFDVSAFGRLISNVSTEELKYKLFK